MDGEPRDQSPFHEGERRMQTRAGVRERAEQLGRKLFRDFMPDQHRAFFAAQPILFVASVDAAGMPHASLLWGAPGFMSSPDPFTLHVRARPLAGDPLAEQLTPGAPLGLLGLEFSSRRRNRMNGDLIERDAEHFAVRVRQSFGNCPQYIRVRALSLDGDRSAFGAVAAPAAEGSSLSQEALRLVSSAETFFIASSSSARPGTETSAGVDMSHRGGAPGFVQLSQQAGGSVLSWPEYPGNNAFNTLGNLLVHPHAGLLFVDFATGTLLSLQGRADVLELPQRGVRFHVRSGLWLYGLWAP
jgi:predicted pyridoxine 5'-phosphate oxidase superfamily flavin-nucleotide-binding protein